MLLTRYVSGFLGHVWQNHLIFPVTVVLYILPVLSVFYQRVSVGMSQEFLLILLNSSREHALAGEGGSWT